MNPDILENFENQSLNILEYLKENSIGLILLVSAFLIIYFVDYINRINALIYATTSPIPGLPSTIPLQKMSKRKFKKR